MQRLFFERLYTCGGCGTQARRLYGPLRGMWPKAAWPLGLYMARVFQGATTVLTAALRPVERAFYSAAGVKTEKEQSWLTYTARTTTDRILAVVPPITAFVAAGFEHSVANMYFIPYALLVKDHTNFVAGASGEPDLSHLTVWRFLLHNLLPVTIGNVIGGGILVGAVYWFAYSRPQSPRPVDGPTGHS